MFRNTSRCSGSIIKLILSQSTVLILFCVISMFATADAMGADEFCEDYTCTTTEEASTAVGTTCVNECNDAQCCTSDSAGGDSAGGDSAGGDSAGGDSAGGDGTEASMTCESYTCGMNQAGITGTNKGSGTVCPGSFCDDATCCTSANAGGGGDAGASTTCATEPAYDCSMNLGGTNNKGSGTVCGVLGCDGATCCTNDSAGGAGAGAGAGAGGTGTTDCSVLTMVSCNSDDTCEWDAAGLTCRNKDGDSGGGDSGGTTTVGQTHCATDPYECKMSFKNIGSGTVCPDDICSDDICCRLPACTNTDSSAKNFVGGMETKCQCGTSICTSSSPYCTSSNNECSEFPICVGNSAEPKKCRCGKLQHALNGGPLFVKFR